MGLLPDVPMLLTLLSMFVYLVESFLFLETSHFQFGTQPLGVSQPSSTIIVHLQSLLLLVGLELPYMAVQSAFEQPVVRPRPPHATSC